MSKNQITGIIYILLAIFLFMLPGLVAHESDKKGYLLVASENLQDSVFDKTVLYILRYDLMGAMALGVNRPMKEKPGAWGGPVETDKVTFVLHSDDAPGNWMDDAANGLAVTSQNERLVQRIQQGEGPRQSLVLHGYSGWGGLQLDKEKKKGLWHIIPYDEDLVFSDDPENVWGQALARYNELSDENGKKKDWAEKPGKNL